MFALDQFNLPGKRYSFAHARTARRPSCCGCVAWEVRTPTCHAPRERWEKCKVQSEAKTAVLKSSLDDETGARTIAAAQMTSTDAWLEGWLARLLQVLRELGKRGSALCRPVRTPGETEARCSKIRAVWTKPSALGHIDQWHGCGWTRHETNLMLAARFQHNHKGHKRITRPRIQKGSNICSRYMNSQRGVP